jgi:hypothetical protein
MIQGDPMTDKIVLTVPIQRPEFEGEEIPYDEGSQKHLSEMIQKLVSGHNRLVDDYAELLSQVLKLAKLMENKPHGDNRTEIANMEHDARQGQSEQTAKDDDRKMRPFA